LATLTLPASDEEKTQLGGASEQNFIRLEKAFGVRLLTRQPGITIQAEDQAAIGRARSALEWMRDTLKSGQQLSEFYLDELTTPPRASGGNGDLAAALGKPLLIDRYGHAIQPKSRGQAQFTELIKGHDIVFAAGPAGTGKTFLAVAMAVQALEKKIVERVMLCRPAVDSGESLGYLPGVISEKIAPYMQPLYDSLSVMLPEDKLRGYWDANVIQIAPLAYMRGRTLSRSFIILDEAQNTTVPQMKMFLTRVGAGSKTVLTGDETQVDLDRDARSGFAHARKILAGIEGIAQIELGIEDVVRHRLVREVIKAYERDGAGK
jgi:phosphate starvation-inducible PhoH-like protein